MLIEADVDTCARHITSIATLNASEKVDILMRVCYFCLLSDLLHFECDFVGLHLPFYSTFPFQAQCSARPLVTCTIHDYT